MPKEDALRWNKRYCAPGQSWNDQPRSLLVEHRNLLPKSGWALDLAMGPGANADFLNRNGLNVIGIDISKVAVATALKRNPRILGIIADLTQFPLPDRQFDLVTNFYYLQRNLWPDLKRILRPGGMLVIETLTLPMRSIRPDIAPVFLLEENELITSFADWNIIYYREGWIPSDHGRQKAIASLIATLPSSSKRRRG